VELSSALPLLFLFSKQWLFRFLWDRSWCGLALCVVLLGHELLWFGSLICICGWDWRAGRLGWPCPFGFYYE